MTEKEITFLLNMPDMIESCYLMFIQILVYDYELSVIFSSPKLTFFFDSTSIQTKCIVQEKVERRKIET